MESKFPTFMNPNVWLNISFYEWLFLRANKIKYPKTFIHTKGIDCDI